jgi:hypothetical protein
VLRSTSEAVLEDFCYVADDRRVAELVVIVRPVSGMAAPAKAMRQLLDPRRRDVSDRGE